MTNNGILAALICIIIVSWGVVLKLHNYKDPEIIYLERDNGKYSCTLGGVLSSFDYDTLEKAKDHCEGWRDACLESVARDRISWKEIKGAK